MNISKKPTDTNQRFEEVMAVCYDLFCKKLEDYGPSWRIMRPLSVADQIFIKAKRIRSIETKGYSIIDESGKNEWVAIVNYGIIALIQLERIWVDSIDISSEEAIFLYKKYMKQIYSLMQNKNHDYEEAWKDMQLYSYIDFILTKIARIRQIEKNQGKTMVSEGIDANYMDIINYALFALIRIQIG